MSGWETLAQVNREIAHPKLKNLRARPAVIFVYSLIFTSLVSFFAVMLIPDGDAAAVPRQPDRRTGDAPGRAAAGCGCCSTASSSWWAALMLAGAVNTAILGSNGVLESRGRGRRAAGLVPQAAHALRHDLPAHQPDRRAAATHHRDQPRRRESPRRGVRFRRGLELRDEVTLGAGAALQAPGREWKVPLNSRSADGNCRSAWG